MEDNEIYNAITVISRMCWNNTCDNCHFKTIGVYECLFDLPPINWQKTINKRLYGEEEEIETLEKQIEKLKKLEDKE